MMTDAPRFPIPLTIITGFLGAGKTTLLNHILHGDHGLRIAVLVNDFGAVNIDSMLVVGVEGETVSLSNGCICCTIRDDLLTETIRLIQRPQPPEYIIVETSGVSEPSTVAQTFMLPELQEYIIVDSILTVMDSEQFNSLEGEYEKLARHQIIVADMVVLNKVDRLSAEQLDELRNYVRDIVPEARIFETTFGKVPLELVIGVGRYSPEQLAGHDVQDVHVHEAEDEHHHHDHDDDDHDHHEHGHSHDHSLVFNTWNWSSDKPFSMQSLQTLVDSLPATIYRAKGFVYIQDYPDSKFILQIVGRRGSLMIDQPWADEKPHNQMVVIGSAGGVDPKALTALFDGATITTQAKKSRAEQIIEQLEMERKGY